MTELVSACMEADLFQLTSIIDRPPCGGPLELSVTPSWSFRGRVFGGYLAAISIAACRQETGMTGAATSHTSFLRSTKVGDITVSTKMLHRRTDECVVRAIVIQEDEITAMTHARMTTRGPGLLSAATAEAAWDGPEPHICQDLAWVGPEYPAVTPFEERGIVYPSSWPEYQNNSQILDVWSRPKVTDGDTVGDAALSQLYDLLLADAHLLEPACQDDRVSGAASLTLDVSWLALARLDQWSRVTVESHVQGDHAIAAMRLRSQSGSVRAFGGTLGRVFYKPPDQRNVTLPPSQVDT